LFAAASALLGLCQSATVQLAGSRAEREFQDSLQEIVAHAGRQDAELPQTVAPPLTGRWRRGPDPAAIRLVLFADYECPHCRKVEGEIERAVAGRGDVSLVVKHYPLCGECNRQIHSQGPHPSACRAALAVEAAGLCGGNGGWWQMHDWLRTHDVRFSDTQLRAAVADLKLGEADAYFDAMRGREALQRVKDDVETAAALGIDGTPTLFVNGMELAHPEIAGAIPRTMAALGIGKLRPRALADDRPRPAQERLAAIWLAGRVFDLSAHRGRWTLGPAGAPYRIVLSICHQNEYSARFSAAVQQLVARRRDVRVEFWHFPLTKRANPGYARSGERDFAASYEMALTAEAAGRLGGNEVFWKMHRWLLEHAQDFAPKAAEQEAARLGLNPQEFAAEIHRGGNCSAVDQDIAAAGAAGIQGAPSIFLDGRQVPGPEPTPALMERILDQMDQMMVR
jgi:protein-disulfide isomerase